LGSKNGIYADTSVVEATSAPRPHALRVLRPRRLLAAFSDERLVELVRRGEAAAFEVLYDRHSAGILGFCRHMLGSFADAEDAVQHTFIAAHADIQRHERDLHVKAWLYTIARNRCLSMLRARREQPAANDDIELVSDRFENDVQQREDLRALLADVSNLPDEQREALVLAEIGDLSHDEISAIIGCEASKVKSLVFQARTALIDRRIARDTPCEEIREQIATLRGGALRRSHLRHHIDSCAGCAEYREEVRRQRAMLGLALPVVPSAALKTSVLSSIGIGGGGAAALGGGAGGIGLGLGLGTQSGIAAKLGIAALLAAGGVGGISVATGHGVPIVNDTAPNAVHSKPQKTSTTSTSNGGTAVPAAQAGSNAANGTPNADSRSASGTKHGFTPTKRSKNGDAARKFAATRGKGKHTGITKSHTPTRAHGAPTTRRAPAKHAPAPRSRGKSAPKARRHRVTHTAPVAKPTPSPPPQAKAEPAPAPRNGAEPTTTAPTPQTDGTKVGGTNRSTVTGR
jgi:RNA polymerase sigma factor (sigma-70 family)